MNHPHTKEITDLIIKAAEKARQETNSEPEPGLTDPIKWPITCTVGPGLEGAIACETRVGYVNGAKGWLIYRGYDIFELCAHSTFEEVCYLLLHDRFPVAAELESFKKKVFQYENIQKVQRLMMSIPIERLNSMEAMRLGTSYLRREFHQDGGIDVDFKRVISADEDSIPMETKPCGEQHAIYEFNIEDDVKKQTLEACYQLIGASASIAATVARLRKGNLPLEPDPTLSFAANFLYMMTGKKPSVVEERIMDVCLILHADHGMNASTFAAMVVASTLSDIYFSVGAGIAALNGPLHGGANEQVLHMLNEIGSPENVDAWFEKGKAEKRKVMGFGHRVYKAYDPRARVLGPLAEYMAKTSPEGKRLFSIAQKLEEKVIATLSVQKKIFPNVDFYSGIVYSCMGIMPELFTPIFAVSRVSGWTARVLEYLENNRIFRPRAMYLGGFDKEYVPIEKRTV